MMFQSALYFLFLGMMVMVVRALPSARTKQTALLLASAAFYLTWGALPALLLLGSALFNFIWGGFLRRRPSPARLWTGITVNVGVLAFFKYADPVLHLLGAPGLDGSSRIVMPLGISFYTFQAMSWLLDVYRGREEDPSALEFILYMTFWPTILSGPVCRLGEMLPQFRREGRASAEQISEGGRRIVAGLFMKMVVADSLARGLSAGEGLTFGFDRLSGGWSGLDVVFLAVGFGFQLFFDFAGYSNIAIGSALLLGIHLRENFNDPYLSRTPTEFWARWHMSLSSWIRDYLFFPLATRRPGLAWRNAALVVSMTIFGVWHGVGATFLLWGLYHGCLLVGHRLGQQMRGRIGMQAIPSALGTIASWSVTFTLVTLGWILFRSNGLGQARSMLGALLSPAGWTHLSLRPNFYFVVFIAVAGYFLTAGVRWVARRFEGHPALGRLAWLASPAYYAAILVAVVAWSQQGSSFVYFQF